MTYLIAEIVLYLLAAALLGLLTGWLVWGRRAPADDASHHLSDVERKLEHAHAVIQAQERELAMRAPAPEASEQPLARPEPPPRATPR